MGHNKRLRAVFSHSLRDVERVNPVFYLQCKVSVFKAVLNLADMNLL